MRLRDPVWSRVGIIDAAHRVLDQRFFSRNGKTKLVVYQHGLRSLKLSVNNVPITEIKWKNKEYIQLDISSALQPFVRDVADNHDFTLQAEADGPAGSRAEVFTVEMAKDKS